MMSSEEPVVPPGIDAVGPRVWNIRWVRDVFWILFWAACLIFVYCFDMIFLPLAAGALLAYLFQPAIRYMERKFRWPRPLTTAVLIVLFALGMAGLFVGFWPILRDQVNTLGQKAPEYLETAAKKMGLDSSKVHLDLKSITGKIESPEQVIGMIFNGSGQALDVLSKAFDITTSILLTAILIPVYFFFFAIKFEPGVARMKGLIPIKHREKADAIFRQMDDAVAGFFRGRVLVSAMSIFLYAFGWYFADVPYWFVLGVVAGIFTVIPYAAGLFWPVAILLKYADTLTVHPDAGGWLAILVWPSLVFLGVQFIEGWILTPMVQGKQMEISVPVVILLVFLGGTTAGFVGLLMCLPIYACLKVLYLELIHPKIRAWTLT